MDRIQDNSNVSRNQNGVKILVWWISYDTWGRNRHSSAGSTFFSFEEGSNFVQNSRHNRTSFQFRRESFLFTLPPASRWLPHRLCPVQTIERTHKRKSNFKVFQAVPATFFCGRKGEKQLMVVSAEQACNRKRFLPWFQFYPNGGTRPGKLNSRYLQMHINALYTGNCACRKGNVQVVSERLVSKAGAFYSLLAQEGQGLVSRRAFLFGRWDLLSELVILIYCFVIIANQNIRGQMKGWHKNHDGKTSLCDTPGWPLVFLLKVSFPACPASKAICNMKRIRND